MHGTRQESKHLSVVYEIIQETRTRKFGHRQPKHSLLALTSIFLYIGAIDT
jgi:hypothetical protein